MLENQRIYKRYVGQYNELLELKKWFWLFHHVMICIIKEAKSEKFICEKLDILKINYTYKPNKGLFKGCDTLEFDKIYYDFNDQFEIIERNEYSKFNDLENDKLILFNIIEAYFNNMYAHIKNNNDRDFYKFSKNRVCKTIPKSKNLKILDSIFQNTFYNYSIVGGLLILTLILYVLYSTLSIGIFRWILQVSAILQENQISYLFEIVIHTLAIGIAFLSSLYLCFKANRLFKKLIPEKGLSFARDLSESQMFLSNMAIIISIISFASSVLIAIYNINK